MHKKLLSMIILLSITFPTIFATTYPGEYSINLNSIVNPELYTITLKYDDAEYSSPIINATFNNSFSSDLFSVELSDGNESNDLQFIINIIPGNFIKSVESDEDYYDTQFKPTPSIDNEFEISSSYYNENTHELTITSRIIPLGKNFSAQTLAKFYLGWDDNENLPLVSNGTYISTTVIEYKSESVVN